MPLLFLLLVLYPVFLAALHVPMLVGYFVLKRFGMFRPWHFMAICAAIFAAGHVLYAGAFLSPGPIIGPALLGVAIGLLCGYTWWYILVKRIGTGTHKPADSEGRADAG